MCLLRSTTKIITVSIFLILLLSVHNYAQINQDLIIVKSIRSVSFTRAYDEAGKEFDNKPGVEIELFTANPEGFLTGMTNADGKYIERNTTCLQIGTLNPVREGGSGGKPIPDNRIRYFVLNKADWNKIKNGAPIRFFYDCSQSSEYKTLNPILYLDKSLLDKPSPKNCPLPLEFAPKLQLLGLGFHIGGEFERAYFNEYKNLKTNVLTLIYTGPENSEKLLPNYDREYLKELKNFSKDFPSALIGIDRMKFSVFDDLIFKQEIIYNNPVKIPSIRRYVEDFSERWQLPAFWSYSQKMRKAELNCANFRIEIDLVDSKPRIVLTNTKTKIGKNGK